MPKLTDVLGAKMNGAPVRRIYRGVDPIMPGIANLATNPGFEDTNGTVEVRRNHAPAPQANSTWIMTPGTGGEVTSSTIADARFKSGYACKGVWTAGGTVSYLILSANVPVAIGETLTYSIRVEANVVPSTGFYTNTVGTILGSGNIDNGDGTKTYWQTITYTANGNINPIWGWFTSVVGTTVIAGDAMITKTPNRLEFFMPAITSTTGSASITPAVNTDTDLTPSWTGTANASASILSGVAVANVVGGFTRVFQSSKWSAYGKSMRTMSTYPTAGNAYIDVATRSTPRGLVAGKTYTVLVTCHIETPQASNNTTLRTVSMIYRNSGVYTQTYSAQASNVAGASTVIRYTYTVPASATEWYLRLYNGCPMGDADAWWDNLMIFEGGDDGRPYRDGSSPGWTWSGTPRASTSFGLG